jgi:formate dehydrogenase
VPQEYTNCRICDASCGLLPETDSGRLLQLNSWPGDPVSGGFICDEAMRSVDDMSAENRFLQPLRRQGDGFVAASWDEAFSDISERLKAILGSSGAQALGMYLGPETHRSSHDWLQAMAFGVSIGTTSIFSSQCMGTAPQLLATEWMVGHPAHLLSDLGRAHYVLLLGEDPRRSNWGAAQAGMSHEAMLRHSRRTKGTKVAVASPRKGLLSDEMDLHLGLRPGTEPFFLLGLVQVSIQRGWVDRQFIRDYTTGFGRIPDLLASWPVERCAALCGLDTAQLSGLALKFSRAAMGVVHLGPGSLACGNSTLGAWAWLALHMVSANLLRPGGLYENAGGLDLFPILSELGSAGAPRTSVGGHPLILMQAPVTGLAGELKGRGSGEVRALFSLGEPPLAASKGLGDALGGLDLLVAFARRPGPVSDRADWILPLTHPWENEDRLLHRGPMLPLRALPYSGRLQTPPDGAKRSADVLRELHSRISPSLLGKSGWGRHFRLLARGLAGRDLSLWTERMIGLAADQGIRSEPGLWGLGESDRSLWRPSGDLLDFVPGRLEELLSAAVLPTSPTGLPLWLRCSPLAPRASESRWQEPGAPSVSAHPSCGLSEGSELWLKTGFGRLRAILRHDDRLLPGTVEASPALLPGLGEILSGELDTWTGMPVMNGVSCALEIE